MNFKHGLILGLAGASLSLIALAYMPYGYYTFNRVALTALAVSLAVIAVKKNAPGWIWGLAPIALLWNPAIPVYLNREIWAPLNVIAAVFFVICGLALKRAPSSTASPTDTPK